MSKNNKKISQKLTYHKNSLSKLFLYASMPLILMAGAGASYFNRHNRVPDKETISFMVDTLALTKDNYNQCVTLAQYSKAENNIKTFWLNPDTIGMTQKIIKYTKGRADMLNRGLKKLSSLLHENRHKHNYAAYKQVRAKFYRPQTGFMLPEHQAELFMHDEIAANIVQILYARDLYRCGFALDSIPLDCKAYKEFLQQNPVLDKNIGDNELQIISQMRGEWVKTFRDHYGTAHGISINGYCKEFKKKEAPTTEESQKIFDQIINNYYSFNYNGKTIHIPFERIDLSDKVKKVIAETMNPPAKQENKQQTVDSLRKTHEKKRSAIKKGSGRIFQTDPLPNYNPKIAVR